MTDRLGDLAAAGVSIWLDDLSRERLASGNLQSLITDKHVVGVTTNPTIFANALAHGEAGAYRNRQVVVLAKRMDEPFTLVRSAGGDRLSGVSGDWVMQYAPGDYGVVQAARFAKVYRLAD